MEFNSTVQTESFTPLRPVRFLFFSFFLKKRPVLPPPVRSPRVRATQRLLPSLRSPSARRSPRARPVRRPPRSPAPAATRVRLVRQHPSLSRDFSRPRSSFPFLAATTGRVALPVARRRRALSRRRTSYRGMPACTLFSQPAARNQTLKP
jgi:hypothetical protein